MIDQDLINDILKHADIVKVISSYIPLTRKGRNFVGKCPFHDDHSPSLTVSPEKQIYTCWVCQKTGSVFSFVRDYERISFIEAVKKVADLIGYHDDRLNEKEKHTNVDPTKAPLYAVLNDLTVYYEYILSTSEGDDGYAYLQSRKLDDDVIKTFRIGFSQKNGFNTIKYLQSKGHNLKDIEDTGISSISGEEYYDHNEGRVIFPLCNKDGQVVGYSARRIDASTDSKYINSPETKIFHKSDILYNYHNALNASKKDKFVYVLEGFMDVIALYRAGIQSAVAIMGTAFTPSHITLLKKLNCEIRLALDSDGPGQDATMTAAKMLSTAEVPFRIVRPVKNEKDADIILDKEGADALKVKFNNLISFNEFLLIYHSETSALKDAGEKKAFIKNMMPFLVSINSQLELEDYIIKLSKVTGYDPTAIRNLVLKYKNVTTKNKQDELIFSFHPERRALKKLQMAESEILYQMIHSGDAVKFYESTVKGFYDELNRLLANYVLEAYKNDESSNNVGKVITLIESNEDPRCDELKHELLSLESTYHPKNCTNELLNGYFTTIVKEKERINMNDRTKNSLSGKSEEEKARILAEINKEKCQKFKKEKGNENGNKENN